MSPSFIDADQLAHLLPIGDAIDAIEAIFASQLPETPQRVRVETATGELLLMPAIGSRYAGIKLVTVAPGNASRNRPVVQATYVLLDGESLTPVSVIDGTELTALRTAAVSGLATRHLANPGARTLVIFGAGTQANAHLVAMAAVREIGSVRVVSRSLIPAQELAARAGDLGMDAAVAGPEVVAEADIVCTCTTSAQPVLDGSLLRAGAHVNAVGAYRPDQRELDDETVRRGRIVVETRESALAEAGDLLIPMGNGVIGSKSILADLAEVVRGKRVRRDPGDVTVFKSVGVAFEDLAVAAAVYERSAV
ncbi:MAG: ornithine cyclodeaminase family protein [Actinomycetota bacterium]